MKFGFIAKHQGIWPADWLCGALGVSRGGFYAWLRRQRSRRSRSNEELGAKVRASFIASDRTYGARRVWHDLLVEGIPCGLHRIERLMRRQALKARLYNANVDTRQSDLFSHQRHKHFQRRLMFAMLIAALRPDRAEFLPLGPDSLRSAHSGRFRGRAHRPRQGQRTSGC